MKKVLSYLGIIFLFCGYVIKLGWKFYQNNVY